MPTPALAARSVSYDRRLEQEVFSTEVTIPTAAVLALFATPQTVVAAPGAGYWLDFHSAHVTKAAGTAYAGVAAGEDLVFKFTDASGAQVSGHIETTGFLDQTTFQGRAVKAKASSAAVADVTPVDNAALVLHLLSGEITTGDSDLKVRVSYSIRKTSW
jgi:hypothetical protein